MAGMAGHSSLALDTRAPRFDYANINALQLSAVEDAHLARPNLSMIRKLHRHSDGYVSFASSSGDEFRLKVAIKASHLDNVFPQFLDSLLKDSFVSVNASWRLAHPSCNKLPFGYPKHTTDTLRYLCACYSDLDFYKVGIPDFGTFFGTLIEYQDCGVIPPASLIVRSGRGAWLLWLLRDPKRADTAASAYKQKLDLYVRIQEAIHERLAALGSDALDAARYLRVPGSLHTSNERVVQWWLQGQDIGQVLYTLEELALAFHVPLERPARRMSDALDDRDVKQPNKRRGWVALNRRRLREIETLRTIRRGFRLGHRNRAALLFAWLLKLNGVPKSKIEDELAALAAECQPRLTPAECRCAMKSAFKRGKGSLTRIRDKKISNWLQITPDEAQFLERLQPASRFMNSVDDNSDNDEMKPQVDPAVSRRSKICELVQKLGHLPPFRQLAAMLTAEGHSVSHVQVSLDCRHLGLESTRSRCARNTPEILQPRLPALTEIN